MFDRDLNTPMFNAAFLFGICKAKSVSLERENKFATLEKVSVDKISF